MSRWICAAMLGTSLAIAPGVALGQGGRVVVQGVAVRGSQGYLGVDIRDVSEEQVGVLKLKESRGAEILRVDHDGPAGKAGLREHDVILQMNGQVVEGEEQLRRMLRETPAGRTVSLLISREGQQQTVSATMANREEVERLAWQQHMTVPEPGDGSGRPSIAPGGGSGGGTGGGITSRGGMGFFRGGGPSIAPGGRGERGFLGTMMGLPYTGATLEPIGSQLAEFFGVQGGAGLLVRSVEANSPASTSGLKAGDVVVKINQVAVAGIGDWSKTVHENKGKPMPLTVLRDKKEQTLVLTPDPKRRSAMEWPDFGPGFAGLELPDADVIVAEMRPMLLRGMDGARVEGEDFGASPELNRRFAELQKKIEELERETGDLLN